MLTEHSPTMNATLPRPDAPQYLGKHLIAEFYGCPSDLLTDHAFIETAMNDAARHCGATIVDSVFHLFNPYGVSGAVIIAESHLTIHTWPEYHYAAVDVFTCGNTVDPEDAIAYLARVLKAEHHSSTEMNRGNVRHLLAQLKA